MSEEITVDEATGRAYDPEADKGQAGVAEAFGPPDGFDPSAYADEARGVKPEDKLPGVPAPGTVSGPTFE